MNFDNKVVIITGAGTGIGKATAIYLSTLGANLAITGRNEENLQKVAAECKGPTLVITADLTNEADIKKIIDTTVSHYKKLDVLINNAGIIAYGNIEETSLEQFDRVFQTNVRAVLHITQLAIPHLIATKGNIVNISSTSGLRASKGYVAYSTSKAALDRITECSALGLADKGVRVNGVNPGVVATELQMRGGMSSEDYEKFIENCKLSHPLGRAAEPIEVAKTIAFLASDNASNTTGALVPCDGGRHVPLPLLL